MQSSAGNHCDMAEADRDNVFWCVCVCVCVCVYPLPCLHLCVWMGSPASGGTVAMTLHTGGIKFSIISPEWINTHNLPVSYRLSLKCSVQARYGNVVKWPTGISDRIRDHRDLVVRPILLHQNLDT